MTNFGQILSLWGSRLVLLVGVCVGLLGLFSVLWHGTIAWFVIWRPYLSEFGRWNWRSNWRSRMFTFAGKSGMFLIAFALGYMTHERRDFKNREAILDLRVLNKYSANNYLVQYNDGGLAYNLKLCGPDPDWDPGMTIREGEYINRGNCRELVWFAVERHPLTGKFVNFMEETQ